MNDARPAGLLAWQWRHYGSAHANRRNLLVHAVTVPLFMAGTVALPLSVVFGPLVAASGVFAMVFAVALQGRGHRRETEAPAPFRSPFDAILRLFVEQWLTFPRYVLSGEFRRALGTHAHRSPDSTLTQGSSQEKSPSCSGSSASRSTPERT